MARQPTQSDMAREDVADRPRAPVGEPARRDAPGPSGSEDAAAGAELDRSSRAIEVVAVFGPTASGKSALAEALADALATEVVSADAMQVYRGLPILTNQSPRPARLVAIRDLGEEMSVGAFASLAHTEIDWLVERHGSAVVAGGTGLYLRAALADLDMPPAVAPEVRERIRDEVARHPRSAHGRLANLDAEAAFAVHPHDAQRLARALELAESGHTLVGRDRLWSTATRRPTLIVGLDVPADELERRIRRRTERMFDRGVVDEVRNALAAPVSHTAEKALGLREIAMLERRDALERIVVRTRRYAAYQRKWMRRIPGIVLLDGTRPVPSLAADVLRRLRG